MGEEETDLPTNSIVPDDTLTIENSSESTAPKNNSINQSNTSASNSTNNTVYISELEFVKHQRSDDCYIQVGSSVYNMTPVINWYPVSEHITAYILDEITSSCAHTRPDTFLQQLFPDIHQDIKNLTYVAEIKKENKTKTNTSNSSAS